LQGQSLTGASFTSVEQLKQHINAFVKAYNEGAEPFVWTNPKSTSAASKDDVLVTYDSGC
jgi:phage-related protein